MQAAQLLSDAAAQGALSMNEYEDRLSKAYAAKTYDELFRLSADLPGAMTTARRGGPCHPAPSTLLLAILSGFERRGRWNVPKRLTTFALWGGGVVDLRYADFTSPEVEIHTYSIMGAQTILVPPEVNVDLHGRRRDGHVRPSRRLGQGPARRTAREGPRLLAVGQGRRQAQEAQVRLTFSLQT